MWRAAAIELTTPAQGCTGTGHTGTRVHGYTGTLQIRAQGRRWELEDTLGGRNHDRMGGCEHLSYHHG